MERKVVKALVDAGAVKRVSCIANGGCFYIEVYTSNDKQLVTTADKKIKTWRRLDAAAKWLRDLGVGKAQIDLQKWQPGQGAMVI